MGTVQFCQPASQQIGDNMSDTTQDMDTQDMDTHDMDTRDMDTHDTDTNTNHDTNNRDFQNSDIQPGNTKGRVRRVDNKRYVSHEDMVTATDNAPPQDTPETDTETVLQARFGQVATDILGSVLSQAGVTDTATNHADTASNHTVHNALSRREVAAAKARQMRLNAARAFLSEGKLTNAKQRLFDILDSAPESPEADTAAELLLGLAAHYENIGQTRWALDLYDDLARYG